MQIARTTARIAVAALLSIALADCYQSEHEVFGPKDAAIVPGLPGRYDNDKSQWLVAQIRHTPDYTFRSLKNPKDPPIRFRAVPLGNDLYLMQLRPDPTKPNVWHVLFRITRRNGRITEIEQLEPSENAVKERIRQLSSVTLNSPPAGSLGDPEIIAGPNDALASLVKSFASLPSETQTVFRRVD